MKSIFRSIKIIFLLVIIFLIFACDPCTEKSANVASSQECTNLCSDTSGHIYVSWDNPNCSCVCM